MAALAGELLNSQNGGRIFAAPVSQITNGQAELWVNLGAPFSDTVQHVPYCSVLQPVYSKEKYEELLGELLTLLRAEFPKRPTCNGCCVMCAQVCAPCLCIAGCLCCCCIPCFAVCFGDCMLDDMTAVAQKITEATGKAQKLVEGKTGGTAKLRTVGAGEDPVVLSDAAAVDQRGEPLKSSMTDENGDIRQARDIWPPYGVNLIFTFPQGTDLNSQWPPAPNQAQMIGNGS